MVIPGSEVLVVPEIYLTRVVSNLRVSVKLPILLNPFTVIGIGTDEVPGMALMMFDAMVTGASAARTFAGSNKYKINPKKTNFFKNLGLLNAAKNKGECTCTPLRFSAMVTGK